MTTNTNPSASEIAANLTTACVHAWQAMGRLGASSPTNALHATYVECQSAIESAGPGLHLRCAEDAAEIARLQAQVDALAEALVSAVSAMDLVEDSILGVQRKRKPDHDGYYSERMHKDGMDRVTKAKRQGGEALNSVGR